MFNAANALVNVFIDPDCVSGIKRRHTIQKLESLGAAIVKEPKYARFIVVPQGSDMIRNFVEDWQDKTFVYISWIDQSIATGHLLVEDEAWNAHLAVEYFEKSKAEVKSDFESEPSQNRGSSQTLVEQLGTVLPTPPPPPQYPPSSLPPFTQQFDQGYTWASHDELVNLAAQLPSDILRQAIQRSQNVSLAALDIVQFNNNLHAGLPAQTAAQHDPVDDEKPAKRLKMSAALVFEKSSGQPYTFYVQVDLKARSDLIALIKKHGGKVVSDIAPADFTILSKNSKDFGTLLIKRLSAGKPAVPASFVFDSVEKQTLLDVNGYKFEASPQLQVKTKQSMQQVKVKVENRSTPPLMALTRSPTPPPESTRRKHSRGYFYPEEEWQYVQTCLPFLLKREPSLSNNELGIRMHEKMSHHSASAWGIFLSKNFQTQLQDLRSSRKPSRREVQDNPGDVEDDLETLTDFFAFEVDGDLADKERFALLSQKARPKTAASWEQFLEDNRDVVTARFEQKIK